MIAIGAALKRSSSDASLSRKIHNKSVLEILVLATEILSTRQDLGNTFATGQLLSGFNLTGQPYLKRNRASIDHNGIEKAALTIAQVSCERRYDADMHIGPRRAICMTLASQGGSAMLSVTYKNTKDGRRSIQCALSHSGTLVKLKTVETRRVRRPCPFRAATFPGSRSRS